MHLINNDEIILLLTKDDPCHYPKSPQWKEHTPSGKWSPSCLVGCAPIDAHPQIL
jgi:hypothetical protein